MSELLAQRQLGTEGALVQTAQGSAAVDTQRAKYAEGFLNRVQEFFEL